jgi:hypothetical protein
LAELDSNIPSAKALGYFQKHEDHDDAASWLQIAQNRGEASLSFASDAEILRPTPFLSRDAGISVFRNSG